GVITNAVSRLRPRGLQVQAAHHDQTVTKRFERLKNWRELEARPVGSWRPVRHHHDIRDVNHRKTLWGLRDRTTRRGRRRDHRIQQRQRHRRADPAQHRTPRETGFGDYHVAILLEHMLEWPTVSLT